MGDGPHVEVSQCEEGDHERAKRRDIETKGAVLGITAVL
jgi:hypothetical protein